VVAEADPDPGFITTKKMIKKMAAKINKTIAAIIPITRGLLVSQRKFNLAWKPGCGTSFI